MSRCALPPRVVETVPGDEGLVAGRCLYNPHDEESGESFALLHSIVSTNQGASFAVLVHDYVEQGDGSVTRELVSRVELGASVEPEWTVGPVDHWHQDGPEVLGVILKHPRRNKSLKNLCLTQELVYMYIYIYICIAARGSALCSGVGRPCGPCGSRSGSR